MRRTQNSNLSVFMKIEGFFDILHLIYSKFPRTEPSWGGSYMRAGTLPYLSNERIGAAYSEYVHGEGRTMESQTYQVPMARERFLRSLLFDSLNLVFSSQEFTKSSMFSHTVDFECISVSNVSLDLEREILETVASHHSALAICKFDDSNPLHLDYLWKPLVLKAIATDGDLLTALEYAPEEGELKRDATGRVYLFPDKSTSLHPHATGQFYVFQDQYQPILEEYMLECPMPPKTIARGRDLHASEDVVFGSTPSGVAIQSLRHRTYKKPSSVDVPDAVGYTVSPPDKFQFPDPQIIEKKVRDYCLAVGHESGKWKGFAGAGYCLYRTGDVELLANSLCSALYNDFAPYETRTTADGSLQFTVDILLPARRRGEEGGFVPVTTAWFFSESKAVRLATAYVSGSKGPLNATQSLPRAAFEEPEVLWKEVCSRAREYGLKVRGREYQAAGWLWIGVDQPQRADFVDYIRTQRFAGVVSNIDGKKYLQVGLPGIAIAGLTQMYGTLRQAQVLLGIAGVHCRIEVRGD